ncbi:hypothetical protein ADEAN_000109700 [Angomonas deanei]|uniref:Uncharacterized protein n=1 Tax=Angomonas deanei TaxID=59799 RepID=A0A7G2C318_9TRYP|nr:hypothetical protein ADEAN_000109700 [Angomonas deanei]
MRDKKKNAKAEESILKPSRLSSAGVVQGNRKKNSSIVRIFFPEKDQDEEEEEAGKKPRKGSRDKSGNSVDLKQKSKDKFYKDEYEVDYSTQRPSVRELCETFSFRFDSGNDLYSINSRNNSFLNTNNDSPGSLPEMKRSNSNTNHSTTNNGLNSSDTDLLCEAREGQQCRRQRSARPGTDGRQSCLCT